MVNLFHPIRLDGEGDAGQPSDAQVLTSMGLKVRWTVVVGRFGRSDAHIRGPGGGESAGRVTRSAASGTRPPRPDTVCRAPRAPVTDSGGNGETRPARAFGRPGGQPLRRPPDHGPSGGAA